MLTIIVAIFAGIFLAHIFADALKAAAVVVGVLLVIHLCRGVTFEALVDEGAHALFDDAPVQHYEAPRPVRRI